MTAAKFLAWMVAIAVSMPLMFKSAIVKDFIGDCIGGLL